MGTEARPRSRGGRLPAARRLFLAAGLFFVDARGFAVGLFFAATFFPGELFFAVTFFPGELFFAATPFFPVELFIVGVPFLAVPPPFLAAPVFFAACLAPLALPPPGRPEPAGFFREPERRLGDWDRELTMDSSARAPRGRAADADCVPPSVPLRRVPTPTLSLLVLGLNPGLLNGIAVIEVTH
ncbi:MAG: hypothetical protein R3E12_17135 [Candidatus Eisenbacteria bacterium]